VSKPAKRFYNVRYTKLEIAKAKALKVRIRALGWLGRLLLAVRVAWSASVIWVKRHYFRQIVVRWARAKERLSRWKG